MMADALLNNLILQINKKLVTEEYTEYNVYLIHS
jgi:hypothetical protein